MPLTLIQEDGTAKPDSNTYASVADGDTYHDAHLYATAWTAATTANKEKALAMATRLIDEEFQFNGFKATTTQALQWPRIRCPDIDLAANTVLLGGLIYSCPSVPSNKLPVRVVQAACELARELLVTDRTAAPAGEGIAMQRNADLSEISYNKKDRPPILTYPVQALLCKYGTLMKKANTVRLSRA
jgi:hypothetical protein